MRMRRHSRRGGRQQTPWRIAGCKVAMAVGLGGQPGLAGGPVGRPAWGDGGPGGCPVDRLAYADTPKFKRRAITHRRWPALSVTMRAGENCPVAAISSAACSV